MRLEVQRVESSAAYPSDASDARGPVGILWVYVHENLGVGIGYRVFNQSSSNGFGIANVSRFDKHDERLEV
jgi:hypothetical protein